MSSVENSRVGLPLHLVIFGLSVSGELDLSEIAKIYRLQEM
jgi:hypothetical protein